MNLKSAALFFLLSSFGFLWGSTCNLAASFMPLDEWPRFFWGLVGNTVYCFAGGTTLILALRLRRFKRRCAFESEQLKFWDKESDAALDRARTIAESGASAEELLAALEYWRTTMARYMQASQALHAKLTGKP